LLTPVLAVPRAVGVTGVVADPAGPPCAGWGVPGVVAVVLEVISVVFFFSPLFSLSPRFSPERT
jgi:hypothetical protein